MYFQFLLLDDSLIDCLIAEGYTHAVLQEYIPAAKINRPSRRDLITFRAVPIGQPAPDGAIPLRAACFANGLRQDEKDYYLFFDQVPQGTAV